MSVLIPHLSLSALEAIAKIIGDRYTGSETTLFFRKAGFPQISHDGSTKWRFILSALESLQREAYGDTNIAKILETLCNPQEFFGNPDVYSVLSRELMRLLVSMVSSLTVRQVNWLSRKEHIPSCDGASQPKPKPLMPASYTMKSSNTGEIYLFKDITSMLYSNVAKPLTGLYQANP